MNNSRYPNELVMSFKERHIVTAKAVKENNPK